MSLAPTAPNSPVAEVTEHPAYRALAELVEQEIAPRAVEVDATEVPRSHVDALREIGYFGWIVPEEFGGQPIPPAVKVAADDLIFGACPSTGIAVTQHGGPVAPLLKTRTPAALELLPRLATGQSVGTTGFSQIRARHEQRSTIATRVPGGYRFDGPVTYLSGWGLADIGHLGAVDPAHSTYVFGISRLDDPAIESRLLSLAGVHGSRTAALTLHGLLIPDELVAEVVDIDDWDARDGLSAQHNRLGIETSGEQPQLPATGPVGLARAALADALSAFPDEPSLQRLSDELERAAVTPLPEPGWRAQLDEIAVRATTAAMVAHGGRGLQTTHIAQVRARAALFLQVRGLSPRMRTARFELLTR